MVFRVACNEGKKKDAQSIENDCIQINNKIIERVSKFLYLGTWFQKETDQFIEIKTRIGKVKTVFSSMKNIHARKGLGLSLRVRLIRCYVIAVLIYGVENWVLTRKLEKRIEAMEMIICRHLLKISSKDKVTNK